MNYFNELLESYSRLKKRSLRLLEDTGLDPNAEAKAKQYISQADSVKQQPSPNYRVQVAEAPGSQIWVDRKGSAQIFFNGFGGRAIDINPQTSPDGYKKFVGLFSGQSQAGGGKGLDQGAAGGMGQGVVAGPTYPFGPRESYLAQQEYNQITERICETLKDPLECEKLKKGFTRLLNTGDSGTITRAIDNYRYISERCAEDVQQCKAKLATGEDQKLKERTSAYIKYALSLIKKGGKLTKHESDWLRDSVIISSKTGQIIIRNKFTGEGMLFADTSDHMRLLIGEGAKTLIDENGNKIDLTVSTEDFIKVSQPAQASVLRGQFLEDLHIAAFMTRQCTKMPDGPEKNACSRKARDYLLKWKDKISHVRDAFREYVQEKQNQELVGGTLASDLNSDDALFSQLGQMFGENLDDPTFPVNQLITRLQKMTARGIMVRNPDFIIPMGQVTGYGRRADALEIFNTREAAVEALVREGYPRVKAEKLVSKEPITKEEICSEKKLTKWCSENMDNFTAGYALNISLKNYYDLEAEELKLGQQDIENMTDMIEGTHCKPGDMDCEKLVEKNLRYVAESLGIKGRNLSEIRRQLKEVNDINKSFYKNYDSFMKKLPKEVQYYDKNGKLKSRTNLQNFLKTTLSSVLKNTDHNDPAFKELKSNLESTIQRLHNREEGVSREEILSQITFAVQQQQIDRMLSSDNPEEKTLATQWLASRALFTGGSSDRCVIQVNELKTGESLIVDQNDVADEFSKLARGEKSNLRMGRSGSKGYALFDENNKEVAVVEHSVKIDKNNKPQVTARLKISRAYVKSKNIGSVGANDKASQQSKINNSTILNYLKNQQLVLEDMIKLISKDV